MNEHELYKFHGVDDEFIESMIRSHKETLETHINDTDLLDELDWDEGDIDEITDKPEKLYKQLDPNLLPDI